MGRGFVVTLEVINGAAEATFVAALADVFERSSWIAARTWPGRPFASVADLHAAMCAVLAAATRDEQVSLIAAHPDLAARTARFASLTPASRDERFEAGLDRLTASDRASFATLGALYRARFGFPFVICLGERTAKSIVGELRARVRNGRESEIATAVAEIEKIARVRLAGTVRA